MGRAPRGDPGGDAAGDGLLPGEETRALLDVQVESEERTERYVKRKISYQSAPGERVPAWLLIPNGLEGKAPAMLVLHQTSAHGKDEAVGPEGMANLHLGRELAERGYVVLAPTTRRLANTRLTCTRSAGRAAA